MSDWVEPVLMEHQRRGLELAGRADFNFAYFFDIGTGKSCTAIQSLRKIYTSNKRIMKTVVLSPRIVCENWLEEFSKHSKIPRERIFLLLGDPKKRAKILAQAQERWPAGFIVVTNYDKLVKKRMAHQKKPEDSELVKALREWGPEVVILDESHKIKDRTSGRTKAVHKLTLKIFNPSIRHRILLSGTPVLKDPTDLFSQFQAMDDGQTFGNDFWTFKLRYMVDKNAAFKGKPNYFPDWQIKPGALDEINARMQDRSMSIKKEQCLDLPTLVRERRRVEMLPAQRRAYMEMKKDLIAFLDDKACTARMALTKALRLMQIASGFAQMEDGTVVLFDNTEKELALRELLEENAPHHKIVVWSVFRENYETIRRVCASLNLPMVEVNGDVADKDKWNNIKRFQEDPTVRVCSGHPGSGGIGVNMTKASISCFFSRDFNWGNDKQAEGRNHRLGSEQHEKLTRIDLVVKDSIEERVLERLDQKGEISEALLREIVSAV